METTQSKAFTEPLEIITDLIRSIEKKKQTRENIKTLNPEWEQLNNSNWGRQEALCWIHGATDVGESIALEKWLYHDSPLLAHEKGQAINYYQNWEEFIQEHPKRVYTDFSPADLQMPVGQEKLVDYINTLAEGVSKMDGEAKEKKEPYHHV